MIQRKQLLLRLYGLLWLLLTGAGLLQAADPTGHAPDTHVLNEYVRRPDPAYAWSLYHKEGDLFARYYLLNLTSQQWLDTGKVDRPLWTHIVRIAQPRRFCGKTARHSATAIFIISGSSNKADTSPGKHIPLEAGLLARSFCRTVIELRQIPNQPLTFTGDNTARKEDALLAYSLDRFLRGDSGDWPAHLAMVKAVVRGMDAVQEFSRSRDDIPDINDFVLIGTSKRGWTAWLTAALDPRIRALVPVSIDMPNLPEQFPHHFAVYGDYARALADYKAFNIGCRMSSKRGHELLQIIDPLAYRERLQMPKLVLNSAGDEFFVSDSSQFYFEQMPGENRLRYTVNTDHRQRGNDNRLALFQQARNWIDEILAGKTPPSLRWQRDEDNRLTVWPSTKPRAVKLWQADNPAARDFRRETLGPVWQARTLKADADGAYRLSLQTPVQGWRAVLVEITFARFFSSRTQIYTTPVFVLPEILPFTRAAVCKEQSPP